MNYKIIQKAIDKLYKYEHEEYLERMKNTPLDYKHNQTCCGITDELCKYPDKDNCYGCEEYKKLEENI